MNQTYFTPHSFHSNAPLYPPSRSSPISPYQHAVPAQRVRQQQQQQQQYQNVACQSHAYPHCTVPHNESSGNLHGSTFLVSGRVTANSFAQSPSSFSNASIRSTPTNPWDQTSHNPSGNTSTGLQSSPVTTLNDYDRWCFVCENPTRPFKTLDGFKRHVREHDTRYYCVPQDPLVYTPEGPRCASCDLSNPDLVHLNTHNVPRCVGRKFTRKKNLITHLEKHGVPNASVLAEQSEYTEPKKYFACGFCVFCCESLNEQANHIDTAHYRFSEHIRDWDHNKVIRGLLSQPVVKEYWRGVLAARPHLRESWFRWNHAHVQRLKQRLEMSREPAGFLCNAALDESNYGRGQHGHLESVPVTGLTDLRLETDQLIQTFPNENALSPMSYTSEQSYTPQPIAPTLQSQYRAWDSDRLNNSERGGYRPFPQIASQTHGSTYQHTDQRVQPSYSPYSDEGFMQHQYPADLSSTASVSGISQVFEGQAGNTYNSRLGGHSPGLSPNVAINPRSRQVTETHTHQAHAHASLFPPTLASQSMSSPLLPNREISPLDYVNRAYGPHYTPLSREETRDRHGMDTEFNSDNQQTFLQDQNRSRRQRRYR